MAESMTTNEMQAILAQDDWLRRAAQQLFRNTAEADDAAQETWAAELRRSESSSARRPWSLRVLRNQKYALLREEARRQDHASDVAARGERFAPATDEVVSELQLREQATSALLKLDEPLRTPLFLRYVKDLPVGEVAMHLGVAQSTASERISRGLEKLRVELDQQYGSDRSAWRALLAPIAAGSVPARSTGVAGAATSSSAFLAWAATAVALLVLSGIALFRLFPSEPASVTTLSGVEPLAQTKADASGAKADGSANTEVTPLPNASGPSRAALLASAAPPAVPPGDDEQDAEQKVTDGAPKKARITATVLLPDGTPAVGAAWNLRAISGRGENLKIPGKHKGLVGADGSMDISFPAPDSIVLVLGISLEGYVANGKQWSKLLPGDEERLGKIRLEVAGSIVGKLVDPEGRPILGKDWRLQLMAPGVLNGLPASLTAPSSLNPQTGSFAMTGLPAGKVQVNYYVKGKGWQAGPVVTVVAGEVADATIVQDGTFKDNQPKGLPPGFDLESLSGSKTGKRRAGFHPIDGKGPLPPRSITPGKKSQRKPNLPIELTLKLTFQEGVAQDSDEVIEAAFCGKGFGDASYLKGKGSVLGPGTINANEAKDLWVRGKDWIVRFPVQPSMLVDGATLDLTPKLSERRVRFLADGKPLVKRRLDLQVLPMRFMMRPRGGSFQTDADGWATVRLGALPEGETYRFSMASKDPAEFSRFIEAPWPHPAGNQGDGSLTLEFEKR